jgi:glycogen synthase
VRVLFLTNFYPPESRGGYELWCQEVAAHLGRSRHEVVVLTSRTRMVADEPTPGARIARELYLEMEIDSPRNVGVFFFDRARRARANLACANRWLDTFQPDVVLFWGMWNLDRSLAALVERRCGRRTVYYFGDYWPTLPGQWRAFWDAPARSRLAGAAKRLLKGSAERRLADDVQPPLSFPHGLFPSDFMRRSYEQAPIPIGRSEVVPGGVVTEAYRREADRCVREQPPDEWKVLVAGRLTPEKGFDTAVRAVALMTERDRQRRWSLTIAGTGEPGYVSALTDLAIGLRIADRVHFVGAVPPGEMPRMLCEHDVFVFPSTWNEPFGRVLVEAMAAGVAVVGTTVGGAGEILRDGETGLAFAPGDAEGLAAQLERLAAGPELRQRLIGQGQATAVAEFDSSRMAVGIEEYLEKVIREEDIRR